MSWIPTRRGLLSIKNKKAVRQDVRPSSFSRQYSTRWYFTRSDPRKSPQNGMTPISQEDLLRRGP